jgi:hypothetical protein
MRTTLDIDEDVLIALKSRARKERKSLGKAASEIIRESLGGSALDPASDFIYENGLMVLAPRGEVITLEHVQKLLDEEDY